MHRLEQDGLVTSFVTSRDNQSLIYDRVGELNLTLFVFVYKVVDDRRLQCVQGYI
jgi:hypothetical protein